MEEEKEYLPIDLSKNKCYATVEEMMRDCVSPEIMEEVARLAAASTVSSALTTMRIKAGISREIMAGALGCSLRRISSLEMANNDRINMPALLKYVEVTGLPFKAVLEDGRTIKVSTVPKRRKAGTSRKK